MVHYHEHGHAGEAAESGGHASHSHHGDTEGIRLAFFINLSFALLEIAGGLWTNSMAILADALHDLGDSFALGSSWYFERISTRQGDKHFSYGYRRFSLMGAMVSIIVLVAGSFVILTEAAPRLFFPEPAHARAMVVFAVIGILVNGAAALRLRGREGINARIVFWHLLEDVLGWIAILVTGAVLLFWEIPVLDAALSILITLYVLFNVLRNFRTTMNIFLQGTPPGIDLAGIESEVRSLPGISGTHHTHVWTLDGIHHVLTMHAGIQGCRTLEEVACIKDGIRQIVQRHGISHSTVELELEGEVCRMPQGACRGDDRDDPSCR